LYHAVPGLVNLVVRQIFGMSDRHSTNLNQKVVKPQLGDRSNAGNNSYHNSGNQDQSLVEME
jgi:hypothetical protein